MRLSASLQLDLLESRCVPALFVFNDPRRDVNVSALGGNPTELTIELEPGAFAVGTEEDQGEVISFTSIVPIGSNVAGFRVEFGADGKVRAGAAETGTGTARVELSSSFGGEDDALWVIEFEEPVSPPTVPPPPPSAPPTVPPAVPPTPPSAVPPPAVPPAVPPSVPPPPAAVPPTAPPPAATVPVGQNTTKVFAAGSGAGIPARVEVFEGLNRLSSLSPEPGFTGGVRVAVGDVTGDGVPEVVTVAGPGGSAVVRVFTLNGQEIAWIPVFEDFRGGAYVAADDIDGDGKAEIAVTPDEGGGPRVMVFSVENGQFVKRGDFFGIEDTAFRGGARPAFGDVNGDGRADLLVAAGFGGGPRLAVFDGASIGRGPAKLLPDFFVFEPSLRNGVFVTSGDINGDGFAEVIAGGGPGGGPRVFALSGRDLLGGRQVQLANFFAGDTSNRGGIRLAAKDFDGNGRSDLVTGAGPGVDPIVTKYPDTASSAGASFTVFDVGFFGGIYVG